MTEETEALPAPHRPLRLQAGRGPQASLHPAPPLLPFIFNRRYCHSGLTIHSLNQLTEQYFIGELGFSVKQKTVTHWHHGKATTAAIPGVNVLVTCGGEVLSHGRDSMSRPLEHSSPKACVRE